MKKIKFWLAKRAAKYLERNGDLHLIWDDGTKNLFALSGDGNKLVTRAVIHANQHKDIFCFYASIILTYLTNHPSEERVFLDKLKESKEKFTQRNQVEHAETPLKGE